MDVKNLPHVAIIIINWNGAEDTCACLESLRKLNYPEFSIHVVDNGSTDNSVEVISERFPEVNLHRSDENLLFAGGNNFGWQFARKENPAFLLFLNNDTEAHPDFLSELIKIAVSDDRIGIVGPKIYYYDKPDLIWSAGGKINFFKGLTAHHGLREKDTGQWDEVRDVDYLTGCAQLIRAGLFEKLGGYDESYGMYTEDADLCYRARLAGYRIVFAPKAIIRHKVSSSSGGGLTPYKISRKIGSNFRFFRRYARWYHWITIPVFTVIGTVRFLIGAVLRGKPSQAFALLRGFGKSLNQRQGK